MSWGRDQYINVSYTGRMLLKEHLLSECGNWMVYGEDANADMGGSHYEPFLGIFTGTLDQVIDKAVNLPSFWQWGGGGRIRKVEVTVLNNISSVYNSIEALLKTKTGRRAENILSIHAESPQGSDSESYLARLVEIAKYLDSDSFRNQYGS